MVTGKCNEFDWYRINYNGNEAYVSCSYLIDEKIVDNMNNDTNNNPNNENNNSEEVQQPNNTEEEEEIVKVPTTPEPEWGTIKYEMPNDGWSYMPIHIWDNWDSEDNEWIREVRQTTFGHEEQDDWEVFEISEKALISAGKYFNNLSHCSVLVSSINSSLVFILAHWNGVNGFGIKKDVLATICTGAPFLSSFETTSK